MWQRQKNKPKARRIKCLILFEKLKHKLEMAMILLIYIFRQRKQCSDWRRSANDFERIVNNFLSTKVRHSLLRRNGQSKWSNPSAWNRVDILSTTFDQTDCRRNPELSATLCQEQARNTESGKNLYPIKIGLTFELQVGKYFRQLLQITEIELCEVIRP